MAATAPTRAPAASAARVARAAPVVPVLTVFLASSPRPAATAAIVLRAPIAVAVREASTRDEAVTAYAEMARVISARVNPLLRVLLGSRGTDEGLAEFAATTDRERHVGSTMAVRSWHEQGWIRPDLTIDKAADIVWALNSPGPRWLLEDRGWSDDEVTAWLADMIRRGIFSDEG